MLCISSLLVKGIQGLSKFAMLNKKKKGIQFGFNKLYTIRWFF